MSRAELLAALAGVLAALAVGLLAQGAAQARGRGRRPRTDRSARLGALLARLGRRAGVPLPTAADLQARLDAAGAPAGLTPSDVAAAKAGAALAAALAVLPLGLAAPGRLTVVVAGTAAVAAFLLPDLWLRRRARHRAAALALEVADVVDLLRVAMVAGLAPGRALREVARRRRGLLADEMGAAARRIELGEPRAAAYAALAARCPLPAVHALVGALERADRHGSPLAEALVAIAVDARAARARALQLRAARAAPKIQLVVALLLVPAVLLLVAGVLVHALA